MAMGSETQLINLAYRLKEVETAISKREEEMDDLEAKVYLADLTVIYKRYVDNEMDPTSSSLAYVRQKISAFDANFEFYPKITNLRIKLSKIISRYSSKSSAEARPNNPDLQTIQPVSVSDSDLKLQIQKQKFLIKQIELVKITYDVCPVKAQVLYDHVEKLYERFISNQVQIETQVDGAALVEQQTIAKQTQQKVIDTQTGLKKITTSNTQYQPQPQRISTLAMIKKIQEHQKLMQLNNSSAPNTQMSNATMKSELNNQEMDLLRPIGPSPSTPLADPNQTSQAGPSVRESDKVGTVKAQVSHDDVYITGEQFLKGLEIDTRIGGATFDYSLTPDQKKLIQELFESDMPNSSTESEQNNPKKDLPIDPSPATSVADPNQTSQAAPSERQSEPGATKFETEMNTLKSKMDNLILEMTNMKTKMNNLATEMESVRSDIDNIKRDTEDMSLDIENVRSEVEDVRSETNELRSELDDITSDVENVKTDVEDVRAEVDEVRSEMNDHF